MYRLGMHTIAASPNPDSDLPSLEATARERGIFIADRLHYGANWRLVLLQRIDNQTWCKTQAAKAAERSARLTGRNPVMRGDAITLARAAAAQLGGAR